MTDGVPAQRVGRRAPGWLFVVVPMVLAATLIGGVAIAVRSSGDDDGGAPQISGPAAGLPAVTGAADELLGARPPDASMAGELGTRYGEVTVGFTGLPDPVDFAAEFERLPDAEAKLLGRTLGSIQAELSPTALSGPRTADDRAGDIEFALQLGQHAVQAIDPDASARDQALAVLPFSVQDLTGFDALAATFAAGDMATLAPQIDGALSDAGAAELVSSVAFLIGQRIPTDDDLQATFMTAYTAALP